MGTSGTFPPQPLAQGDLESCRLAAEEDVEAKQK